MALDEFTRHARRRHLGSSDAAAIIDRDPFGRTAGDVWAEKTGRLREPESSTAMTLGAYLEPAILSWTEDTLGTPLQRDRFLVHPNGILCANVDALALHTSEPSIVEAKSAGLIGRPGYLDQFGEPGTDEVPSHVTIQGHHQLAVARTQSDLPPIDVVLVPALLIGRGFVLYRVPMNPALCDALVEEEERFWRDHIMTDVPPPETPSLDTLRRFRRREPIGRPIDRLFVEHWLQAKRGVTEAKALEEMALADLIAALGDADTGTCDRFGTFTYKEQTRKAYTVRET